MAEISASVVKELREKTGAGMMDCKKALGETNGNIQEAIEWLRKKGMKDLGKRADKVSAEGVVECYIHPGNQVAVILELNCETDFVARGPEFSEAARGIAMHVAAMNPAYLSESDVPAVLLEKEKEILRATLTDKQKEMEDKILPGKLAKFYEDNCLLNQSFIKDDAKTVGQIVNELGIKCGEKVTIRRYQRFEVGEGIEKRVENLAEVVSQTIAGN